MDWWLRPPSCTASADPAAAAAALAPPPRRPLPLPHPAGRRGAAAMAGPGSYTNGPGAREAAELAPAPKRIKVNSGSWQHFVGPSYAVSGLLCTDHRMTVPLDHSGAWDGRQGVSSC